MHSRFRLKGVLVAVLAVLFAAAAFPGHAAAEPQPGAQRKGFRLFARSLGAMTINKIYCGLSTTGEICVDSTNSSTIGGGFWPKGTVDQYVFNSGLQIAGVIGANGGVWAGDTVGGFFFDPKGTTQHGQEVAPLYNASNPDDINNWPAEACVPNGDASELIFNPLLRTDANDPTGCRKSASQGDVWFISAETNAALRAGRKHPLGIAVEQRGMGWNFPTGNDDILYFVYTFYNVSSLDPADYAAIRPSLRSVLLAQAQTFHSSVATTGVDLPDDGYDMVNVFPAFAADMDVADAGSNYAGVNLPFALGYTYDHAFAQSPGWTFDPSIFSAPFFPGAGFVGVKYLKSPTGPGAIQLFGTTVNGTPFAGAFNDPRDVVQLYRYLSGTLSTAAGDQPCNTGDPAVSRICNVNNTSPQDMRFFQSSTPLTLKPGEFQSIVVAYIFAAPVQTAGCATSCDVKPGDGTILTDRGRLPAGANLVDSISGFRGWSDLNADTLITQDEFSVVPGSLLGKALVAQSVFDNLFLLPFAPSVPDFFLVPGDNQVTVLWKPTSSEATGDPFFAIASSAQLGGANNALYDPNYREFDVEGYRVYRGRVDAPNELTLLAQFDFAGTVITDYTGIVNPTDGCAPEFGVIPTCPENFSPNNKDGTQLTVSEDYELSGQIIQVKAGSGRTPLAVGRIDTVVVAIDSSLTPPDTTFGTVFVPVQAQILKADTLVTRGGSNGSCGPKSVCPELNNSGVPYVFLDRTSRNNFRYFYSVTAFDVNSVESGPTSLESPRVTKSVTPVRAAGNVVSTGSLSTHVVGRGNVFADTVIRVTPTLNSATGTFSGPARPADGTTLAFAGELASQVVGAPGVLLAVLDSLHMGQADLSGCCGAGRPGIPAVYFWTVTTATDTFTYNYAIQQELDDVAPDNRFFNVLQADDPLSSQYGGDSSYTLYGNHVVNVPKTYDAAAWGLGIALGGVGYGGSTRYNGSRWFDGPSPAQNETEKNPIKGACGSGTGACAGIGTGAATTTFNNAGKLTGVTTIHQPLSYTMWNREWRNMEASLSSAVRAADFNVYWGTAGKIDSVLDVTHQVLVPFESDNVVGGGWGVLNTAGQGAGSFDGRATVLTAMDWACVEPLRGTTEQLLDQPDNVFYPCTSAAPFVLSDSVIPGLIAFGAGNNQSTAAAQSSRNAANLAADAGFSIYIAGRITMFELTGGAVPSSGTVWALRSYVGNIKGGKGGPAGDLGPYTFTEGTRPFTAVGAQLQVTYSVTNQVNPASSKALNAVHTVPDPYYVTNGYEQSTDNKVVKFVNLPDKAIIRIYSASGVLVNLLEHPGPTCANVNNVTGVANNPTGGECTWNVRNRNNQVVASGVYFYHVESNSNGGKGRHVGRMTIVNFAQ